MSYPPDTFMLTEQAQIIGFNPSIMYVAIGGVFPSYRAKFGDKVNGILAYGGQDTSVAGYAEYDKAHKAMFNRPSEAGALSAYSAVEIVQQAIEQVGEVDRPKIRDVIANGKFKTIWGELSYVDQRCASPWAVGQWQNGEMVGVFPSNKSGAKPAQFPKPKWS
jgi:branched-chain amino acid transport system substrate-binding protein